MEMVDDASHPDGKQLKITTPSQVVSIHTKDELEAQLQHYDRPFVSHVVPDNQQARRNYVEAIRPALRYYCAKFGVKVPKR